MIYTFVCLSINFSAHVFAGNKGKENKQVKPAAYLHWPHMQADQVHGLALREIGGGFTKHHRAPSVRAACYAIAKPSTMVQKMETIKQIRGHRDAVYCGTVALSSKIMINNLLAEILSYEILYSYRLHASKSTGWDKDTIFGKLML